MTEAQERASGHSPFGATSSEVRRAVSTARNGFDSGLTRTIEWRLGQLASVRRFLQTCRAEILDALAADLGKPAFEAYASDIGAVLSEVALLERHLPRLVRPRRVATPIKSQPATTSLVPEPLGTVLVLPAWNFPIALTLIPLAGAVAAGNSVIVKPSELAPACSALLARRIPDFLDRRTVAVIEGGASLAQELLGHKFGHIHFTGSSAVGRAVMRAAAEHLTPVTLELGGKNPAYVHGDVDAGVTGRRLMFGRLFNAGQTCMSPDYVLVRRQAEVSLLAAMIAYLQRAYGDPSNSPDLGRIVNRAHFDRVVHLLDGAGEIVVGGGHDADRLYIAPTIVRNVPVGHPILHEEIFGPILPIVAVGSVEHAIHEINRRPKPLTMYIFSADRSVVRNLVDRSSAGSVVVNQMFTQGFNTAVPFGGVGESGMGAYTGLHSFECFSHLKPVVRSPMRPELSVLYPPYRRWKRRVIERVLR